MGDLLHLYDAHAQTQRLLPWYVNGTLEPEERAMVSDRCADCAECRADLAAERALRESYAGMQPDIESGWATLQGKVAAARRNTTSMPPSFLRRPVALGWAIAGNLAIAACAVIAVLAVLAMPQSPQPAEFRLLGEASGAPHGNIIVLFAAEASAKDLRDALDSAGSARIVDGPTASGAYVVSVDESHRTQALEQLRALPQVALAEPLSAIEHP